MCSVGLWIPGGIWSTRVDAHLFKDAGLGGRVVGVLATTEKPPEFNWGDLAYSAMGPARLGEGTGPLVDVLGVNEDRDSIDHRLKKNPRQCATSDGRRGTFTLTGTTQCVLPSSICQGHKLVSREVNERRALGRHEEPAKPPSERTRGCGQEKPSPVRQQIENDGEQWPYRAPPFSGLAGDGVNATRRRWGSA